MPFTVLANEIDWMLGIWFDLPLEADKGTVYILLDTISMIPTPGIGEESHNLLSYARYF